MADKRLWQRDELLVVLGLYCRIPFGKMDQHTPEVIECARLIGRTPGAVTLMLVNFASRDPFHQKRGVGGMKHIGTAAKFVWNEYYGKWDELAQASAEATTKLTDSHDTPLSESPMKSPDVTERESARRVRIGQDFFRRLLLAAYTERCAVCQLPYSKLLVASHIIPWSEAPERRVDPTNGLCLCAFHDKAFDTGFMSLDNKCRVILSRCAKEKAECDLHRVGLHDIEGQRLIAPERFVPDPMALEYHRENIFDQQD